MKNSFSELLTEIIEQSDISKNEMIRACDIDRSSFFKFLSGNRIPTMEQFNKICGKLQFSPLEEKRLRMEYARITNGEKKVAAQGKIIQFLWKLEETEKTAAVDHILLPAVSHISPDETSVDGKQKVMELLADTIAHSANKSAGKSEIGMYFPPIVDAMLDRLLVLISELPRDRVKIRQLIELPSRNPDTEHMVLDRLKFALLCASINPEVYTGYYYYANTSMAESVGVFYAYSLIAEDRVVLFNERMNKAIIISDPKCCSDYKNSFMTALNSAKPVIKKTKMENLSKEATSPVLFRYGSGRSKEISFGEASVKYISPAYIRNAFEVMNDREFEITGRNDDGETVRLLKEIRNNIGKKVFFVDERNIPPANAWCIALSGDEKLVMYRNDSEDCLVLAEPEIVQTFYRFMEELPGSGNLLRNDLAEEIIDDIIAHVQA